MAAPAGYPTETTGYIEPWIASPGEKVDVKISSTEPDLDYHVVRLVKGPQGIDFSGMHQERIASISDGKCRGHFQLARPGSYGIVPEKDYNIGSDGVEISLYFKPSLLDAKHVQTLISTLDVPNKTGFAITLNTNALIEFWIGTGKTVEVIPTNAKPGGWSRLVVTIMETTIQYSITPVETFTQMREPSSTGIHALVSKAQLSRPARLVFAASFAEGPTRNSAHATNFFNGRIAAPTLTTCHSSKAVLGKWDFSQDISTDNITDISGNGANGQVVNAPTRAVTDHEWDGTESDWTKAKYGYGAIHFHEDDIDDAGWETNFSLDLPHNLRSGAYGVVVQGSNGVGKDVIPFYVRATESTSRALRSRVAFVISTFTYLAYANEHVYDRPHVVDIQVEWKVRRDEHAEKVERRIDVGLSCYDMYNDHTGVIHSSAKRPILNMRPDYISWNFHRPRGLSADLLAIEFLERSRIPYDVVYDHDLHLHGKALLSRYDTVITSSHPEYHTVESLGAFMGFIKDGGNLMYLGGNGFYWSCAVSTSSLHRVEIRRGDQGVRAFTMPGGERLFSTNGQQGLLWRSRGLPANVFLGNGCCSCGDGPGVSYQRTDSGRHQKYAWVFDGIPDGLIGVNGFGGGASGDEIDKCDFKLGSPTNTVVLATSTGHPDEFAIFPEDVGFPMTKTLGTQTNEIRSDMTYYETENGGAVFSVGSINWFCSLGWNNFDNEVARLTGNVLKKFTRRERL